MMIWGEFINHSGLLRVARAFVEVFLVNCSFICSLKIVTDCLVLRHYFYPSCSIAVDHSPSPQMWIHISEIVIKMILRASQKYYYCFLLMSIWSINKLWFAHKMGGRVRGETQIGELLHFGRNLMPWLICCTKCCYWLLFMLNAFGDCTGMMLKQLLDSLMK